MVPAARFPAQLGGAAADRDRPEAAASPPRVRRRMSDVERAATPR